MSDDRRFEFAVAYAIFKAPPESPDVVVEALARSELSRLSPGGTTDRALSAVTTMARKAHRLRTNR